jgi:hypothetical protein
MDFYYYNRCVYNFSKWLMSKKNIDMEPTQFNCEIIILLEDIMYAEPIEQRLKLCSDNRDKILKLYYSGWKAQSIALYCGYDKISVNRFLKAVRDHGADVTEEVIYTYRNTR